MNLSMSRINAIVMRHLYLQFRELYRIAEAMYWPLYDICQWGLAGIWMQTDNTQPVLFKIVAGMTLWQMFYRNNLEISSNILEEIWERNMTNLFSTPLKLYEWVIGMMILALLRSTFTMCICIPTSYLVFGINIFFAGPDTFAWLLLLTISGWTTGLLSGALLITFGRQAMSVPWIFAWLWAPLIGALFPVSVLPPFLQKFSYALPMSYVFEDMRSTFDHGRISYNSLYISAALNVVYLIGMVMIFKWVFKKTKEKGLARLS